MLDELLAMSDERFASLYGSLEDNAKAGLDVPIARMLNSRVATAARRPLPMKLKALRAFLRRERDEDLALDMLRSYFLGPRKALVVDFLDGTGVEHEDGQIGEDDAEPDGTQVAVTVEALLNDHDKEDVRLYLAVARRQWPEIEAIEDALGTVSEA